MVAPGATSNAGSPPFTVGNSAPASLLTRSPNQTLGTPIRRGPPSFRRCVALENGAPAIVQTLAGSEPNGEIE